MNDRLFRAYRHPWCRATVSAGRSCARVGWKPLTCEKVAHRVDERVRDVNTHRWEVATGHYQVYVGASSQDVRCRATLILDTLQSREA